MKFKIISLVSTVFLLFSSGVYSQTIIRMAYVNNPGEPVDLILNDWKNNIEERSSNNIKVELYPSSQLGSQKDVTELALAGVNVVSMTDAGFLSDYDPDIGIMFGPYLTESSNQLFDVYSSDWWKKKETSLAEKGVRVIASNFMYGVRQIMTKDPVLKPEDLRGMKIRTPANKMQIAALEAMGAAAVPMPLGEVYSALSQGVIDGVENPLSVLDAQKFSEVAKNISMVSYLVNTNMLFTGEAFWQSLTDEEKEIIKSVSYESGILSQEMAAQSESDLIDKFKKEGVSIHYVDMGPFKEKAMLVYEEDHGWSDGLYSKIQSQLK